MIEMKDSAKKPFSPESGFFFCGSRKGDTNQNRPLGSLTVIVRKGSLKHYIPAI